MRFAAAVAAASTLCATPVLAEPYLAVREGFKCVQCHVNPTGGGMRNAFGNAYAQTRLPAGRLESPGADVWSDALDVLLSIGGDLRTTAAYVQVPNGSDAAEFDTQELRLYVAANVIPQRLVIYADQRVAPGSLNQEAYARLWLDERQGSYLKAGKLYLPFGLRLEDDTAFTRIAPGINMTTPDDGVEWGHESGPWTAQLAVSNGSAGGPEADRGKQYSSRAEFVQPDWRVGASANYNDTALGSRRMAAVFAGLRTGAFAWLAEADYIVDGTFTAERTQTAALAEGNWHVVQGHNLKLTTEYFDPDDDVSEDERNRHSALWEYTPIQFLQLRLGTRFHEGIPQNDLQNRREYFLELHGFF